MYGELSMESSLVFWDYAIIASYIIFAIGIGVIFSKKVSKSTESYFLSNRSLP